MALPSGSVAPFPTVAVNSGLTWQTRFCPPELPLLEPINVPLANWETRKGSAPARLRDLGDTQVTLPATLHQDGCQPTSRRLGSWLSGKLGIWF